MLAPTASPFLQAALNGNVAALEQLIAHGADVHEQDEYEQCALHFGTPPTCLCLALISAAAIGGELRIVEILLARGISPDAKDQVCICPAHVNRQLTLTCFVFFTSRSCFTISR